MTSPSSRAGVRALFLTYLALYMTYRLGGPDLAEVSSIDVLIYNLRTH